MEFSQQLHRIKKPMLSYYFQEPNYTTPLLKSYIGGRPYLPKNIKKPLCHSCGHPLYFVFQLHIPNEKKESTLYSFFYCTDCLPSKGNKGFRVLSFPHVHKKECKKNIDSIKSMSEHSHFQFKLDWSLPDWESLSLRYKKIANQFFEKYKEECQIEYEEAKDELLQNWEFDSFSFYGGHPNFVSHPSFPLCDCCSKPMDLWIQLDTHEELGLIWKDYGCLYLFRCTEGKENYQLLIQ
jgi:uncharacterized protein YwqG